MKIRISNHFRYFLIALYVVLFLAGMFYLLGWQTVLKLFTDPQSV